MKKDRNLRLLIAAGRLVVAPGVYDAFTARMVAQHGFPAAYMTGSGVSQSRGYPDLGLLTMTEMADSAATLARAINIPVIADGDAGYGNELNVTRTVLEYELRGVAAIQLEDQVATKRCGHLGGKELVSTEDFVAKIRAAVAARTDPDFLIIARSDARAVYSLDDAIERVNAALEAGADIGFVEAPQDRREMEVIPGRVNGPCLLNTVYGGVTPNLRVSEIDSMGYKVAIFPSLLMVSMIKAGDKALQDFLEEGMAPTAQCSNEDVRERFRRFGLDEWNVLRTRFRTPAPAHTTDGTRK